MKSHQSLRFTAQGVRMAVLCMIVGAILGFMLTDLSPAGGMLGGFVGFFAGLVIKERRQIRENKEAAERRRVEPPVEGTAPTTPAGVPSAGPQVDTSHWSAADKLRWDVGVLKKDVAFLRGEVERLSTTLARLQAGETGAPQERGDFWSESSLAASPFAGRPVVEPTPVTPVMAEPPAQEPADRQPFVPPVAEPAPFESLERSAAYEVFEPTLSVEAPSATAETAGPEQSEEAWSMREAESSAGEAETAAKPAFEPVSPAAKPAPEPSFAAKALAWFTQGNTMVRVGVVVLFFGLAFLLKYAADQDLIPLELRLILAGLFGLGLLGLGWWLRRKRPDFALPVQGGGVAIFYLTSLAAAKLFATDGAATVLPVEAAFAFMAGICVLSTMLAVLQRDQIMALLSFAGGRLAPILLSTGEGNHLVLFSFYGLLTLGEIAIVRFLPWRLLPLVSFVFTLGVGAFWGATRYVPEFFPEAEGFLLLFFFLYAGISVFQVLKGQKDRLRYCDTALFFAVPLAAGTLQWFLLRHTEFGMAFSCLGLGAVYLGLAGAFRNKAAGRGFLFDSALALGVAALTLAVPFALSRDLTAAAWCVEGAALVWIGARLKRSEGVAVGLVLQVVAGALYTMLLGETSLMLTGYTMFLNKCFVGGLLLTLSGLVSALSMSCLGPAPDASGESFAEELRLGLWLFASAYALPAAWALFWWCVGGTLELYRHLDTPLRTALLGFFVLTTAGVLGWARLPRMEKSRFIAVALVPVLLLMALSHASRMAAMFPETGRPWYELTAWLPVLGFALWTLRRLEAAGLPRMLLTGLHVGLVWTICLLVGAEFTAFVAREVPEGVWRICAGGVVPALVLLALCRMVPRPAWPVGAFERAYLGIAPVPLAGFLALWLFLCLWGRGDPSPLPYIPVLNPLDLTLALGVAALIAWVRTLRKRGVAAIPLPRPVPALTVVALVLFLWWNVALLRGLHHLAGFGFSLDDFLGDLTLQKCLAAGWVIFAAGLLRLLRGDDRRKAALLACLPILALTFIWALFANRYDTGGRFGVVPFLNPLDLIQIAGFALAVHAWVGMFRDCLGRDPNKNEKLISGAVGAALAIFWLHAVLLRTLHHWLGIPFDLGTLLRSEQVQAAISVFWTLLAVGPILYSKWKKVRPAWILGAGIMALTVCKLFLVDLSNLSGLERVFSFIVVGVILLVIGYLCPLPPRRAEDGKETGE